jgi:5-methylcytosine-specific restriction endonuclease McrA
LIQFVQHHLRRQSTERRRRRPRCRRRRNLIRPVGFLRESTCTRCSSINNQVPEAT